jgi:hypothetical protein
MLSPTTCGVRAILLLITEIRSEIRFSLDRTRFRSPPTLVTFQVKLHYKINSLNQHIKSLNILRFSDTNKGLGE